MLPKSEKIVLVTGGAGFIGYHLIQRLLEEKPGYRIYSLDNYFTGKIENHHKGVSYIKGNTLDISRLVKVKPDIVFHLGEYSRVETSFEDIDKVFTFNRQGTFAVLEFCRKHNCKIIYAGSSTKFADNGIGRSQSPYAWTKATNTELVVNYGTWYDLSYAITYFHNVYGGREIREGKYATLIGIFKEKTLRKDPLTIVSPGVQIRSFTHVDDIVRGLILVGENGNGDGYGLGSEEVFTVIEIAKMFGGEIEMLPERKGNRIQVFVDTVRAKEELFWKAENSLKDHINLFLSHCNYEKSHSSLGLDRKYRSDD